MRQIVSDSPNAPRRRAKPGPQPSARSWPRHLTRQRLMEPETDKSRGALWAFAGSLSALALVACGGGTENARSDGAAGPNPAGVEVGIEAGSADLVIHGGPIYTSGDATGPIEAVAIVGGRISAVGSFAEISVATGPQTRVIDLAGAALFPGFVDAHAHLYGIGERELTLNLEGVSSIEEMVDIVASSLVDMAPGALLVGRGWIETGWPEGRFPTAADLDAVSPDHPVVLTRADGHALIANTAALEAAGITDETADPAGGRILRSADGAATGMLIDKAMSLVAPLMDAPDETQIRRAYETGAEVYTAYGWTGIHNMSVEPDHVALIERLSDRGAMALRVYNAINPVGLDGLIETGPTASDNGRIITRAVKMYVDGALGSRGAALKEPYSDAPDTDGLLLMTPEQAKSRFAKARDGGIQVATHAIGDRANTLLLDWYEETLSGDGDDRRWRDEHTQIVDPADIPRFAALGVIASMQPSHAIGDLYFAPDRLGPDRLDGAYAWRALIDAGAIIAGGSDAPVERGDPAIEFYAAVARRGLDGYSDENWRPDQAVTRGEALKMFTAWPAFASFQDDELGTITVGKKADLTAFSIDLMTAPEDDLPDARAVLTIIDGEIAHENLSSVSE